MKKAVLLSAILTAALACSMGAYAGETEAAGQTEAQTEADEENYMTGDASKDDPLNQDGIGEKEILVLSFGTSYNQSRYETIGGIERAIIAAYPDWSVRRGFTANIVINHVQKRDGVKIDDINEALQRAADNGVKELVVQPTHLMEGKEYDELIGDIADYADQFESVSVGDPLFRDGSDLIAFDKVIDALVMQGQNYDDGQTAIVYMGHGTDAESNADYQTLEDEFHATGHDNYYVTTVEGSPNAQDTIAEIEGKGYTKILLRPLMVVAGDHAHNDMASLEPDSIRSQFAAAGYEVDCVLEGLGQDPQIQQIYVDHVQEAIDKLAGAAAETEGTAETEQDDVYVPDPAQVEAAAAIDTTKVADASDMAAPPETGSSTEAEAEPVALKDGTYDIKVTSSSKMFNIEACSLTVKDGSMTADMTLGGTGYLFLYPGTAEDAAKADAGDFIYYEEDADGKYTYMQFPVAALDSPVDCAAFSKKKEQWYPRTLTFESSLLPGDAYSEGAGQDAAEMSLADGSYLADVVLEGSGSVEAVSPVEITVKDGAASGRLVLTSDKYDYAKVDGQQYDAEKTDEGVSFEIPVTVFDRAIPIVLDSTAIAGMQVEQDFTLTVDSASLKAQE